MTHLEIRDLRVEYPTRKGTFVAVEDVSLTIDSGEIVGVVGESGAGKSTVGAAAIGLISRPGRITRGEIQLTGKRIDPTDSRQFSGLRGKKISMIFQDPLTSLNPVETVGAQLIETIRLHLGMDEATARSRSVELLDKVGIRDPEHRVDDYPHQFSGGMRQRVVIALALASEPEVIIADEPTTALDVSVQAQILKLLRKLCDEQRVAMILVTHDMGVIAEVTDRVAVMYRGRIVETGPTRQVLSAAEHAYTRSLLSAVPPIDRKLDRFPQVTYIEDAGYPTVDLKNHWLGEARGFDEIDTPLLELQDVCLDFLSRPSFLPSRRTWFRALDHISFKIAPGKTFGLVGESGSGKSTISRVITGIYRQKSGIVRFAGKDISTLDARGTTEMRRQMQMVFQDPYSSLNARQRVGSILVEPILLHKLASSRKMAWEIAEDLLHIVGLGKEAARKFPHEFSGGQRQRISIARALATRPRFLVCDEPTSALDVSVQAQILNLLRDLQDQLGLTMLFVSHDLAVIRQMCDEMAVMRAGRIQEQGVVEELFEQPKHPYTSELLSLVPRFATAC